MNLLRKSCLNLIRRCEFREKCRECSRKSVSEILGGSKEQVDGQRVTVAGWIKSVRNMKGNSFADVNDGSCDGLLQIVVDASKRPTSLTTGASVCVNGVLGMTSKGQTELVADEVVVIGKCAIAEGYPFVPRRTYPAEYVRRYPHLRPRTNEFASLLRIRHAASRAVHEYFDSIGYLNVHTPVLTSNDCEGAGEVFTVRPENESVLRSMLKNGTGTRTNIDELFFGTKAYLTVSGQLHLEAAVHGLSKAYTFGPTFRAENSKSRLHLSEFYMVEAEKAFATELREVTVVVEELVKHVADRTGAERAGSWIAKPFVTMTFDEAVDALSKQNVSRVVKREAGLNKEQEMVLVKRSGGVPTFIVEWPSELKPFYAKRVGGKAIAFDLLVETTGELAGGSLREDSADSLKERLPAHVAKGLDWYLELRRFGGAPTGGFGLGFERLLQFLFGVENIKDVIPFPRYPHNCTT